MRANEITNNTDLNDLKDNSRAEADLVEMVKKLYGEAGGTLPVPKSRMEFLLHAIYEKLGEGGGSVDPADIETVVREWFEEHSEAVATGFNVEFVDDGIEFTNDDKTLEEAVSDYLDAHPEATTTVQDGAITYAKLDSNLKAKADDVGELKSHSPSVMDTEETEADLYVCDANGNVIAKYVGGHIVTKGFDSADIGDMSELSTEAKDTLVGAINEVAEKAVDPASAAGVVDTLETEADLYLTDGQGKVLAKFANGHIQTKKFNSADFGDVQDTVSSMESDIDDMSTDVSGLKAATSGIIYRNKEVNDGLYGICKWKSASNKQFCMMLTGDVHADKTRMASAVEYFNEFDAFDCGIMLGDIVSIDWRNDATFYTQSISRVNKPWLTVIGNHDAGSGGTGATNITSYTDIADLVAKFMTPNIQYADLASGEFPGNNCYYYKDFTGQKIRIIVLNQYDYPPDYDNTNNTFVYTRGAECFSQAQISWLCNTLLNTPTDYGVIIAIHSYPAWMSIDTAHLFTTSIGWITNTGRIIDYATHGFILEEIVNAFITGSAINAEFAYKVTGSWGSGVTVNVDFSNRGQGEFIAWIGGHWHMNVISRTHEHGQICISVPALAISAAEGDLMRKTGLRSEDNFMAIAVDRDKKLIKLLEIGAHFTMDGVDRICGNVSYATV